MRHIRSILYALVLAPLLWALCAVGLGRGLAGRGFQAGMSVESAGGILILVLGGAAYAILLLPRLSPTGPILTGLVYVAVTIWSLVDAGSFAGLWPSSLLQPGFDVTLPAKGLALLLAVPLFGTAFGSRRWRSHDHVPATAHGPYAHLAAPGPVPPPSKPTTTLIAPAVDPSPQQSAEPTQVIGSVAGAGSRRPAAAVLAPGSPVGAGAHQPGGPAEPDGDATQVIRTGRQPAAEATQVIRPPDATQVLAPAAVEPRTVRLGPERRPTAPGAEATHRLSPAPAAGLIDGPTTVIKPESVRRAREGIPGDRPTSTAGLSTVDLSSIPPADRDEPTTALHPAPAPPPSTDESTTALPLGGTDEPTTALRPVSPSDERTTALPASGEQAEEATEQPTTAPEAETTAPGSETTAPGSETTAPEAGTDESASRPDGTHEGTAHADPAGSAADPVTGSAVPTIPSPRQAVDDHLPGRSAEPGTAASDDAEPGEPRPAATGEDGPAGSTAASPATAPEAADTGPMINSTITGIASAEKAVDEQAVDEQAVDERVREKGEQMPEKRA